MAENRADTLARPQQLEALRAEQQRLEAILRADADWRELCRIDADAAGQAPPTGEGDRDGDWREADRQRLRLVEALRANAAYAALAEIVQAIARLTSAEVDGAGSATQSPTTKPAAALGFTNHIDPIDDDAPTFRTRVKLKHTGARDANGDVPAPRQPTRGVSPPPLPAGPSASRHAPLPARSAEQAAEDEALFREAQGAPIAILPPSAPAPVPTQSPERRPAGSGSLLSRLRGIKVSERPPTVARSAYRGIAEEASVTIVRRGEAVADDATPSRPDDTAGHRPAGGTNGPGKTRR